MTHVLTEGDILYKPIDCSIYYREALPRSFIKIHRIMSQMIDVLPLSNSVTLVEDSEFWHTVAPGGPLHPCGHPPSQPQPATPVPSYSFGGTAPTAKGGKKATAPAVKPAADIVPRDQLARIRKEEFGRDTWNFQGFVPWNAEPLQVALHKPKMQIGYRGEIKADKSAFLDLAGAVKIPAGIRVSAGEADFNQFCMENFDYLPQDLEVIWMPGDGGYSRLQHEYLLFREDAHLTVLKLRWPSLIWC